MWTSRLAKNLEECRQAAKHTAALKHLAWVTGHVWSQGTFVCVIRAVSQLWYSWALAKKAYRRLHCAPYSLIRYYFWFLFLAKFIYQRVSDIWGHTNTARLLAREQFSYGLHRIVITTPFGGDSNFKTLVLSRLEEVGAGCGFGTRTSWKRSAGSETHSQGEKHSQGVNFLVSSFNLGFNKRVRMPNPQLQKDILILHLLITTTDSNQNYETHNLARTC